jgi:Dyp-type peroxidase family
MWQELAQDLDGLCAAGGYRTSVVLGVGFDLWNSWGNPLGLPRPAGMGGLTTLQQQSHVFACSGGDLWFHIKSSEEAEAEVARKLIDERLAGAVSAAVVVPAQKRLGAKVLGGRFIDGLENPADQEDLDDRVLVGDEDPAHRGAAFLITQKFVHDWAKLDSMTEAQKQDMIGRDHDNRLIPMEDDSSHIKRVRRIDGQNVNRRPSSPTGSGRSRASSAPW